MLKLGIYAGYNGKFLLVKDKNIIYEKNIPYLKEEKIIKYSMIPIIIKEIQNKAKEIDEQIQVYIVSEYDDKERLTLLKNRVLCQGVIQGILLSVGIKYKKVSLKNITNITKKPYKQIEKNRKLYLIMNYSQDIIDLELDKQNKYMVSNLLIMLSEESQKE